MGDRANVIVKSGDEQVVLYTHWNGEGLPELVRVAMARGKERWNDFQYLTRIIFCNMIPATEWDNLRGYGITTKIHDGGDRYLIVDLDFNTVTTLNNDPLDFDDFANLHEANWNS